MIRNLYISGVAATLALVALVVALALAASNASAPERTEVSNHAAVPVAHSPGTSLPFEPPTFLPFEQSDPAVCSEPGADPRNCSY
jgi:hypothetical protein